MIKIKSIIFITLSSYLILGCQVRNQNNLFITDLDLKKVENSPDRWLTYGRDYQETRYSPLNQINKTNIDRLGLAWSIQLGTKRGLEATPLFANGVLYFTGPWSKVFAVDARKGEIIWTYDPQVPKEYGEKMCCDVVNRGVALYGNSVFVGTMDGRLVALNSQTGEIKWKVLTVDPSKPYSITGAPRIVKGNVIIGNGGAEYGVRGYVTAYDAESGQLAWRFYTVPGNPENGFEDESMEVAADTWKGEWWKYGGGGTVWDAMAYDPELNSLYIGTGNGSPWNREVRSPGGGDNLYLSSIVALDPDNGKLKWYYQTTPGDSWDYTATQHLILADLTIAGKDRKVIMQAPKNGFFYVIDRTNGEFISAKPYVYTNWAKEIDRATGRPIETPFARYKNVNFQISPSPLGGHNWQPMAYNPSTGLVYIPAREGTSMYHGQPENWEYEFDGKSWNLATENNINYETVSDSNLVKYHGKLIAWDPVAQREVWSKKEKVPWNSGVLATKDIIFQGNAEGFFMGFDAENGDELWSFPLESGIVAAPITFLLDGKQYISILVGWGGYHGMHKKYTKQNNPGTLYTFTVDGNGEIPKFPVQPQKQLIDLVTDAPEEEIKKGKILYHRYCGNCHGGGTIPDLKYSTKDVYNSFEAIVGKGAFLSQGMPRFDDRLSALDIQSIKNYLVSEAMLMRTN